MKLSYIIPLYNAEPFIGQCLDSVLDCDLEKSQFEVIVVDDGSTDNGLAVANDYADQCSNIRVFHQENQGQSVARNCGIKEAKGDYIWFVDSDDYVDATHISPILDMMAEKEIEICKFEMKVFREDGSSWMNHLDNVVYDKVLSGEQSLIGNIPVGSVCNGIFLRQFIINNNLTFYPGIIRQDSEFSIRSTALAKRMIYLNKHIYVYRFNDNSCTRSKSYEKKLRSHVCEAIVASSVHQFVIQTNCLSDELKQYLNGFATSIIKGRLIAYITNKDNESLSLYNEFVDKAKQLGEYPMMNMNGKMIDNFVRLVLNRRCIVGFLIKARNL